MSSRVALRARALVSRPLAAAALLGLLGGLASCSHTTSPATSGAVTWITPGKGTVFIYQSTQTDSQPDQQTSVSQDTELVSATGLQYPTVGNAYELIGSTGASLIASASNGDALIGDPSSTPVSWTRLPLTSGAGITYPLLDSMTPDGTHLRQTSSSTAMGTESFSFAGKSYTSYHVRMAFYQVQDNALASFRDTLSVTRDLWIVPTLGSYSRISEAHTEHAVDPSNGPQSFIFTTDTRLISYQPH